MNERSDQGAPKGFGGALQKIGQGFNRMTRRWIENNTVVLILSFVCALLIWVSVAYGTDEKVSGTVREVPVRFDMASSTLERLNLYPVLDEEPTVDVEIHGNRAVVGNATAEEFDVKAKLSSVTGPGTYVLPLEVTDTLEKDLEIKSTQPETVTVRFDYRSEKTFEVELELDGIVIPEGYILDAEYVTPERVTVSGPETEISAITACRARVSFQHPLTETVLGEVALELYDADNNVITSPYLSLSDDTASFTLPVLKKKIVPVTFDYINVPSGFDVSTLEYRITPNEVEIAGPEETVSSVTELHLGYLNLSTFTPDSVYTYDIVLPSSFIAVDNTQEASVTFEAEDYETRLFTIGELKLINAPEEYDVTVATRMIYDVEITGPSEDMERLQASDLVAEIDMSDADLRVGQSTVGVKIIVTSNDTCWASGGTYTAVVTVRSKEASAAS